MFKIQIAINLFLKPLTVEKSFTSMWLLLIRVHHSGANDCLDTFREIEVWGSFSIGTDRPQMVTLA